MSKEATITSTLIRTCHMERRKNEHMTSELPLAKKSISETSARIRVHKLAALIAATIQ